MFPLADLHCDTIWRVKRGADLALRSRDGHVDIPRLRQGGVALQVFAVFVPPGRRATARFEQARSTVQLIRDTVHKHSDDLEIVTTAAAARRAIAHLKIAVVISLEGLHPLEGNVKRLKLFYDLGVRIFGITWNNSNEFAASAYDESHAARKPVPLGLTRAGEQAVAEIQRLGALVDVSHLGEGAFWRIIEIARGPVIASHSLARSVYSHFRNLTDAQIRALASTGGVIGANFCSSFLAAKGRGVVDDVAAHIARLAEIGGVSCAAVGSDFDGISKSPKGLEHAGRMQNLAESLRRRGFSDARIRMVMFGNFMRVFREVCG